MKANKIELVLNGGGKTLDSATVPIKWYFSDEAIEESPKSIVFIDLSEKELNSKGQLVGHGGERHLLRVKDRNQFIQFDNHGTHKILVLAFSEEAENEVFISRIFEKTSGCYDSTVFPHDVKKFIEGKYDQYQFICFRNEVIAAEIIDIEIPQGLFADKPKTKFGKGVYNWINKWHEKEPRDECDYRKRKAFAFTLKPFLWLIFEILLLKFLIKWFLYKVICGTFVKIIGTVWSILIMLIGLFIGYCPEKENLYEIRDLWIDLDLSDLYEVTDLVISVHLSEYKVIAGKKYRLALWEIMFSALVVYTIYILSIGDFSDSILVSLGLTGILGLIIYAVVKVLIKLYTKIKGKEKKKDYREWLRETSNIKLVPKSVSAKDMEKSFDRKIINSSKIRFWATKAEVCKPFAKN